MQRTSLWKTWVSAVAALMILAAAPSTAAALDDITVRGQLDYNLGYGLQRETFNVSELTYKLDIEKELGFDGKVHVGWRGAWTDQPAEAAGLSHDLHEAYADAYVGAVDLRFGRHVVNWGTADGFNPTNVINPQGPLALSVDELERVPVMALQAAYYLPSGGSVTGVAVTEFVPAPDGPGVLADIARGIEAQVPGLTLDRMGPAPVPADGSQMAFAVRGEHMIGHHNVYATYYHGWDHYPAAWLEFGAGPGGIPMPQRLAAEYRRINSFGLATAGTWGDAGVWTELAYTVPEALDALDQGGAFSSNDPVWEAVIGGDYMFAGGVTASAQIVYDGGGSLLSPYKKDPLAEKLDPQTYVIGMVRYAPNLDHEWEGVGLLNAGDRSGIALLTYTYSLNPATSFSVGLSKVFAESEDDFGPVKDYADAVTAGLSVKF